MWKTFLPRKTSERLICFNANMFENDRLTQVISFITSLLKRPYFLLKVVIFVLGLLSIGAGGWFSLGKVGKAQATQVCPISDSSSGEIDSQEVASASNLTLDIGGAVLKPGLYELKSGSRYADLIAAAGGLSKQVSKEFVAKELNLSKELKDQEKVYLPFEEEDIRTVQTIESNSSLVSINEATADALQTLKGVGEVTAQKIISGRPYSELTQLVANKVLSEKLFESLQSQLKL